MVYRDASHSFSEGSEGRNSSGNTEAGTEAEATVESCLLSCSWDLLSLLSYKTQEHMPRSGTAHIGLSPPTSVINQENDP